MEVWGADAEETRAEILVEGSADGVTWKRQSDKAVLSPELPWEKVAVMCPHVLWDGQTVSMYHYVATRAYPYTIGCFRGSPVTVGA